MKGMDEATDRICLAMERQEVITVFGDYDVDGITGSALLRRFFQDLGYPVQRYIPHRLNEGYGLKPESFDSISSGLVITVDNGMGAFEACIRAQQRGIDVIITDHHEITDKEPIAIAILNPKQKDCNFPYSYLSGAGIAFYLAFGLRQKLKLKSIQHKLNFKGVNLKQYLDFVALGAIADKVPMSGLNHLLTQIGLEVLNEHLMQGHRPGIYQILRKSYWKGKPLTEDDVAFKIAPKLNASGRLSHAKAAADLLESDDMAETEYLAKKLTEENALRRSIQDNILKEALEQIPSKVPSILCVYAPHWHIGVVGIIASKLVEIYHRPALVLGSHLGEIRGSGRSIADFSLLEFLQSHFKNHFTSLGGHAMAVGFTLKSFEDFSKDLSLISLDMKNSDLPILCPIHFRDLEKSFFKELVQIQPYGPLNEKPYWLLSDITLLAIKFIGKTHYLCLKICDSLGKKGEILVFRNPEKIQAFINSQKKFHFVVESSGSPWDNQFILLDFMETS